MKILIITHYFLPHTGGIENVAYNQAKGLIKKGHKVTVLSSLVGTTKSSENIEGIKVKRIKVINFLEKRIGLPYPIFHLSSFREIRNEILKNDVIQIHGHVFMTSVIGAYFAKRYNKPTVVTQHNTFVYYENFIIRTVETIADKTLGKYTFSKGKKIIAVSHKTQKYVESITGVSKKIVVEYNGINVERFGKKIDKKAFKKKLGVGDKFVCFTVRRITYKNGIDTILEVAEKLKNEKIIFLIGGKGPEFAKVQEIIKENNLKNVKLLGFISDADLPKYYSISDLFILPSKQGEGFPLVVLEAFASGVPVIATKSGGHEEVIKNGINGYLVNVDKPAEILKRIDYLFENFSLLRKMSKECYELARKNFSWNTNINSLDLIYKEVIK